MTVATAKRDDAPPVDPHKEFLPRVQGRTTTAVQNLAGNTMDQLLRGWAVREHLGLFDQPIETVRQYLFATDNKIEKFRTTDERIRGVIDNLKPGDVVSWAWTYIEIDGRKTISLTPEMRRNHELVERHDSRERRPARVVVARGIIVRQQGSNSGRGKVLFGDIALGLMNKAQDGDGFDFGFALAGLISYERPDRLLVEQRLTETAWVSRASNVRFRGDGAQTDHGPLP